MNDITRLHYKYNFFYITAIMLVVIIALATVNWGGIKELVGYISFGLTLTSLFLALIAIIYAIISNTTFSQHLGKLGNVAQNVTDAASSLSNITNNLEEKIHELPSLIKNVEIKLDETRQDIKDEIFKKSTNVVSTDSKKEAPDKLHSEKFKEVPDKLYSEKFLETFLDVSSFNGLLALYTTQLAHSSKIPFDPSVAWQSSRLSKDYGAGYLVACEAAGMINTVKKDNMWNVTEFDAKVNDLRKRLIDWLKMKEDENKDSWNADEKEKNWIIPIENYFKEG